MLDNNTEFWQRLQDGLEKKVSPSELAIFKRVLERALDVIDDNIENYDNGNGAVLVTVLLPFCFI